MTMFIANFPFANLIYAMKESNFAGQVIVIILFAGSIVAWSIIISKAMELRQSRFETERFLVMYRKEDHPISLYLKRQKYHSSPLYAVYDALCSALGAMLGVRGDDSADLFMGSVGALNQGLDEVQMDSLRNAAETMMSNQAAHLEKHMGLLATLTTTAPLLGLLGTVWGVMDAFGGMVVKGSAMLSAVAPGISGALVTTVIGLIVAIPSAIGYNILTDRIRKISDEMDKFSSELILDIERHYTRR